MYRKETFVFDGNRPIPAILRNYTAQDFDGLIQIQQECFPPPFPSELWWNKEQLNNHVTLFPDGALCVEVEGKLAGSITGLMIAFSHEDPDHSWEEATDSGYIRNHNEKGNTLYIVDISVAPSFRKLGLAKLLMQAMYETVMHRKLERLLGGGRMPGYGAVAGEMTANEYLIKVTTGELKDPVITFLLKCGRVPVRVIENYLDDEESCNYAALMEWKNPFLK